MASIQSRIELCAYLPTKLVKHIQPHLKLAFLEPCDDGEYIDYYRRYEGIKILDNGLIEFGKSVTVDHLFEYSAAVAADYIIPPDKVGNWDYNAEQAQKMALGYKIPTKRLLPCLGGPYAQDFLEQVEECGRHFYGGMCLPFKTNRFPVQPPIGGRLHLLGLKWPEDFKSYLRLGRGCHLSLDTTEFVNASIDAKLYNEDGFTTTQRPKNYAQWGYSEHLVKDILANCRWLQNQMVLHEEEV